MGINYNLPLELPCTGSCCSELPDISGLCKFSFFLLGGQDVRIITANVPFFLNFRVLVARSRSSQRVTVFRSTVFFISLVKVKSGS